MTKQDSSVSQSNELPSVAETIEGLKQFQDCLLNAYRMLQTPAGIEFAKSQGQDIEETEAAARGCGGLIEVAIKHLESLTDLTAQPAEGVMSEWLPIESADCTDGARILGGHWSWVRPCVFEYDADFANWWTGDPEHYGAAQPTHWMPLPDRPAPPAAARSEERVNDYPADIDDEREMRK